MRFLIIITFLSFSLFIYSCRKEKKTEEGGLQIHLSFFSNGEFKNMQYPQYRLIWLNSPINFVYQKRQKDAQQSLNEGMGILFTNKRMEKKTYTFTSSNFQPFRIFYNSEGNQHFMLEHGTFSLNIIDSTNFIYRGNFDGTFISSNGSDSFMATEGEFYFRKLNFR